MKSNFFHEAPFAIKTPDLFDYIIYIGRFEPMHNGHLATVQKARAMSDNLIIICGSANQPRNIKNPFNNQERNRMITESIAADDGKENGYLRFEGQTFEPEYMTPNDVNVTFISDKRYNNQQWVSTVLKAVENIINRHDNGGLDMSSLKIGIIGHGKDESSFYLKLFPQWQSIDMHNVDNIHATDIRQALFDVDSTKNLALLADKIPVPVMKFLEVFKHTVEYDLLVQEYAHIKKYKQSWENCPYAVTFNTADAVVIQSGHVLLVRRGALPGKGLWALPGGFINANEHCEDAAIRELREETKLKVPVPVLKGSIKMSKVFDDPNRSLRGRTITHAYLFELTPGELPQVKGSDDADKAKWIPLNEFMLMESVMFEDHYSIINYMLGNI